MSYVIFARKFRPRTFDEVLGQEPIVTTLQNAIRQKRIPQSFLFSGPRGVGKTSVARILAAALNCENGPKAEFDPDSGVCREIAEGRSMDVLEIDGASNRGIDEIRNLRETVKFKPSAGRYKVYIIDEVHMLTAEAFNALLKTLEEPPDHVKFVFATTEPHKVPLTILSRCQRFHFRRIPTREIAAKLDDIAKKEKIKADPQAVFLMAKASEGSLRDAEGLLDQLASFADKKIGCEDVLTALGLAAEEVYFSVLEALKAGDVTKIFTLIEDLYDNGRDLVQFGKGLLELFRNLLLLQCSEKVDRFIEAGPETLAELKKHKDDFSRGELLLALSLTGNMQQQLRRNLAPPKLLVEMTVLKLLHLDGLRALEDFEAPSQSAPQAPVSGGGYRPPSGKPAVPVNSAAPRSAPYQPPAKPAAGPAVSKMENRTTASAPAPSAQGGVELDSMLSMWPRVIEYVKTKRMAIGIFLSESEPVEIEGSVLTLGFPEEFKFHKETLEKDTHQRLVEEGLEVVTGTKWRIQAVITEAERAVSEKAVPSGSGEPALTGDPNSMPEIITQTLGIFEGAKIVRKD